ncbi:restriction endonuclease subunit S [Bacteroides thetaiotaomicron]|uniref:restriction endonuclease subunit S n=2 Tax=Bacteroidales TaxID=171549 RepID=UPI001CE337B8|nr:restriction endonuclease subunit S [Bacteroides thetaiotaomicron]MCA6019928.1 restriction endonuclease subunit S [Bacteroides thetaiotaomicron]
MDTKKLRQKILDLAIHGKLVPQDPNDEPASVLLERINAEKERLIKEGKIKRSKKSAKTSDTPHYENVPFEVPDSWVWCRLDDLCNIKGGKRIPKGKSFATQRTEHIYLRVTNMKNRTILFDDLKYIDDAVFQEIRNYTISSDDLYLTIAGTIGDVGEIPQEVSGMNLTENAAKLTDIGCNRLYLMYSLLSTNSQEHFSSKFHQVAQPKLSIETASSTLLPLPPLAEQQRIVTEIERWFTLIDQIEQDKSDLQTVIKQAKSKILDLAIHGKLVPQNPNDEPASELLKRIYPEAEITCDNGHYPQLPDGWCKCRLEYIVEYEQPQAYIVNSTDYDDRYLTPVLTAGKSFVIGYTNETEGIYQNTPCIIFDDFTTDSKLVDFPFKVKSSAMKILKVADDIEIEYVAMFMNITRLIGDTHKRYWISEYSKLCIPIPPKEEQKRIINAANAMFEKLDAIMESL